MRVTRRWSALIHCLVFSLALFPLGAGPAAPHAITLDGQRDAGYVLLAVDPAADLDFVFSANPLYTWAELSALYVTTDTTNLYVYVDLPYYALIGASGEVGLAIDTTGDVLNSGGAADPRGNLVTFAYTATQVNTGTVPLNTAHVILPEVVIRGNLPGNPLLENGLTEFFEWNGSAWTGAGVNWGGLDNFQTIGTHIAYSDGDGVEFSIPYADLGVPPEAPLHLQFFTTRHQNVQNFGALDTLPSDDQATDANDPTTLRRLASRLPAAPPPACAAAALGDSAAVVAGLAHDSTSSTYHDPPGALGPGASATFRLRACAGDLSAVDLLVWDTADPASEAPAHIYPLTATLATEYDFWAGSATVPSPAADQWYQFRLFDTGLAGYVRPASGESGPGDWAVTLAAPAWLWATQPGGAVFLPLLSRP